MTVGERGVIIEFDKLPKQLGRVGSVEALYAAWRRMQSSVCSHALLNGMPKVIWYLAKRIYEVEPHMAAEAIRRGDSAVFVLVLVRLSQIDAAMVAAGKSLADRSPVIYAKHLVEGFRTVADESFVALGGTPLPL
jgi:hypothetical protein